MIYKNPIDKARLEQNLGQRTLAIFTGIAIERVSKIVNGDTGISVEEAEQFALLLDIPMSELVYMTTKEYHDEVTAADEVVQEKFRKLGALVKKIRDDHKWGENGEVECPTCGNVLHWSLSAYNGHAWMICETQGYTLMME